MLKLLKIKNIALDPALELELGPGLTLLTGETGAGKSILDRRPGPAPGRTAPPPTSSAPARTAPSVEGAVREPRGGAASSSATACPRRTTRSSSAARSRRRERAAPRSTARWCPSRCCATSPPARDASTASTSRRACSIPQTHLELLDRHAGARRRRRRAVAEPFRRAARGRGRARGAAPRPRARPSAGARCSSTRPPRSRRPRSQPGEEEALRQEKALQANAGRLAALSERGLRAPLRGRGRRC